MTSEFNEIYSRFYIRVKDYDLGSMEEGLAKEILYGYLKATLSKPFVRKLFTTLAADEDVEEIEYELRDPIDDESDKDFVEEVLAAGMVAQWSHIQYYSMLNTAQFFSNKEQSYYSQANHMQQLNALYQKSQIDLRKMIRDYGYSYSIINGVT